MKLRIKIIFYLLLIASSQLLIAQNSKNKESKEAVFFTIAPRTGIGFHNYMNFDFGISALYITNSGLKWGAASAYSSFIFQQTDWNSGFDIKGVKIGIQSSTAIFMWGLEWKTLYYESENYNYLSPKIGLSWLDVVNIEYLLNVLEINENCPINSRHQISINISLNRKIYKNIWEK